MLRTWMRDARRRAPESNEGVGRTESPIERTQATGRVGETRRGDCLEYHATESGVRTRHKPTRTKQMGETQELARSAAANWAIRVSTGPTLNAHQCGGGQRKATTTKTTNRRSSIRLMSNVGFPSSVRERQNRPTSGTPERTETKLNLHLEIWSHRDGDKHTGGSCESTRDATDALVPTTMRTSRTIVMRLGPRAKWKTPLTSLVGPLQRAIPVTYRHLQMIDRVFAVLALRWPSCCRLVVMRGARTATHGSGRRLGGHEG